MAGSEFENTDEFLEAADRLASLASEPGENAEEIEPARRAARQERPQ